MQALDIMTRDVITVHPDTPVEEIAATLLNRRISAVPVVDDSGSILGLVSEGDLMRRPESETDEPRSWWLTLLTMPEEDERRFVKSRGRYARDVMTRDVMTVDEQATVGEIASLLEHRHIKRVPVTCDAKLIGIVSRADLLRSLAVSRRTNLPSPDDRTLQKSVGDAIRGHGGPFVSVVVTESVVHLWGSVQQQFEKDALRVAVENVPGVHHIEDHVGIFPSNIRSYLWAE
jgi:CBS domain-containing protein